MIHYSCDGCGQSLDPENDLRYVVRIEMSATFGDSATDEPDDDRDNLLEVHEILERADSDSDELISAEVYQRGRFDLCTECQKRFANDPFGREVNAALNFSHN